MIARDAPTCSVCGVPQVFDPTEAAHPDCSRGIAAAPHGRSSSVGLKGLATDNSRAK
jgi:hypothetical protein